MNHHDANEAHALAQQRELENRSEVARLLGTAGRVAKSGSEQEGLIGTEQPDGSILFTPEQGYKAACFAREDAAAIMFLQASAMGTLITLRRLALINVLGIAANLFFALR